MFSKGETASKKGCSGRKTKAEEVKQVIERAKAEITQDALIALANSKVFKALQTAERLRDIQGLGLPITLKGIKEVKDINLTIPKPLDDFSDIITHIQDRQSK